VHAIVRGTSLERMHDRERRSALIHYPSRLIMARTTPP
jgi:hypothetical protein